jgi:hypothetical protein
VGLGIPCTTLISVAFSTAIHSIASHCGPAGATATGSLCPLHASDPLNALALDRLDR